MSELTTCVGYDTETHLMGPQNLAPKLVCITTAVLDGTNEPQVNLYADNTPESVSEEVDTILCRDDALDHVARVAHNAAFDLAVICAREPDRISDVFDLLESGHLQCTKVREKLLNLAEFGDLSFMDLPDGSTLKIEYSLAGLVQRYFGEDISSSKKGEDAWRLNYAELEDIKVEDWPQEAIDYAIEDSVWAARIYESQELRRQQMQKELGYDPLHTINFRCMADFCLHLMSIRGMAVDAEEVKKVQEMIEKEMSPENLKHLTASGILRPAQEPRPYKNGAKNEDGTPKMTKGSPESVNTTKLKAHIEKVCGEHGITVTRTEPSDRFPEGQVSSSKEVLEDLAHLDEVLEEYQSRQALQKLVTTEIPRMMWEDKIADVVHPCYDVLKTTGRTSSFASKIYPSFNCQNVDPRARNCYQARKGFLLASQDYNQIELGTLAQVCLNLFGRSVLAEKINEGCDLHCFLGAQIAAHLDPGFAKVAPKDKDECYALFMEIYTGQKTDCDWTGEFESPAKWAKHFRTLAKPTGLGYPGGLGPDTFMKYAKATYGVHVDRETAELLREIWKAAFDEMPHYFEHINNQCLDTRFSNPVDGKVYTYTTPYGMVRPRADYCAAANGMGLQSPSAEGAITAVINVVRACYDPAMNSVLYGRVFPICFVHDEIVSEIEDGEHLQECVAEIERIMVESMRIVTPDVASRVGSALMMKWDKGAEALYDEEGNLIVWSPERAKQARNENGRLIWSPKEQNQ